MVGVCNLAWPMYANVSCISSTPGRSACRPVSSWNSTHHSHCSQGTAKKLFLSRDLLQVKLHWNPPAQLGEAVGKMMITIFMASFPLFHHVISPWNVAYFTIKNVFFCETSTLLRNPRTGSQHHKRFMRWRSNSRQPLSSPPACCYIWAVRY